MISHTCTRIQTSLISDKWIFIPCALTSSMASPTHYKVLGKVGLWMLEAIQGRPTISLRCSIALEWCVVSCGSGAAQYKRMCSVVQWWFSLNTNILILFTKQIVSSSGCQRLQVSTRCFTKQTLSVEIERRFRIFMKRAQHFSNGKEATVFIYARIEINTFSQVL